MLMFSVYVWNLEETRQGPEKNSSTWPNAPPENFLKLEATKGL